MVIGKESFFWHKLHSLTGIIPVGYYLVQHLILNSFSIAGPKYFNGVIAFFDSMPKFIFYILELTVIWIPLFFHAIYGFFIVSGSMPNITSRALRYRENWMYTFQRVTGILVFLFLIYHMTTTTVFAKIYGDTVIQYASWASKLSTNGYLLLWVYGLGILFATYHFSYGIWNFCIRWGITISEKAQLATFKFSTFCFIVLTLLGWSALGGFFLHQETDAEVVEVSRSNLNKERLLKSCADSSYNTWDIR